MSGLHLKRAAAFVKGRMMKTTEIKAPAAAVGIADIKMTITLGTPTMKPGLTAPPAPPPPAPPSIGRTLLRLADAALKADRIASAIEHWWPTVKELGKELLDRLFRRPATARPA